MILAERELFFKIGENEPKIGKFILSNPVKSPEGDWFCHWQMEYLHPKGLNVRGDDKLHSLVRAIDMARDLIIQSIEDNVKVWWVEYGPEWEDGFIAF